MKKEKRIAVLKKAGVAVCDGACAECGRAICTGAGKTGKREEVRGKKEEVNE